jgi:hypothetical protein
MLTRMSGDNRARTSIDNLPPLIAVMLFLTSPTGNAQAADDKACSQQERTNKTLSDKLDQTAGVIVRPKLTLPSRCPHPTLGRHPLSPPPGSPGGDQTVQPK